MSGEGRKNPAAGGIRNNGPFTALVDRLHIFFQTGSFFRREADEPLPPAPEKYLACLCWLSLALFFIAVSCNRGVYFCSFLLAACCLATLYVQRRSVFSTLWPPGFWFFAAFLSWLVWVSAAQGQKAALTLGLWLAGFAGGLGALLWGAAPAAAIIPVFGYVLAAGLCIAAFSGGNFTAEGRFQHLFGHPNPFGVICSLAALSLFCAFTRRKRAVKALRLLALAAILAALALSGSRTSMIALACAALAYGFFSLNKGAARFLPHCLRAAVLVLAVYSAASVYIPLTEAALKAASADRIESVHSRMALWESARASIKKHPAAGLGLRSFPAWHARYVSDNREHFVKTYGEDTYAGDTVVMKEVHNQYLEILQASGFTGFFLFTAWLFFSLRFVNASAASRYVAAVLVCYLIIFLFETPLYNKTGSVMFFLGLGMLCGAEIARKGGRA